MSGLEGRRRLSFFMSERYWAVRSKAPVLWPNEWPASSPNGSVGVGIGTGANTNINAWDKIAGINPHSIPPLRTLSIFPPIHTPAIKPVAAFNSIAGLLAMETTTINTRTVRRIPIIIMGMGVLILQVGGKGGATEVSGLQAWCWEKAVDDRDNIELTSAERAPGTELSSTADKDANAKTNFIIVARAQVSRNVENYWDACRNPIYRFVRRDNLRLFYSKNEDRLLLYSYRYSERAHYELDAHAFVSGHWNEGFLGVGGICSLFLVYRDFGRLQSPCACDGLLVAGAEVK
eukprot:scaffold4193_cov109-Skeletonema_dohrnii-CCMP3373.AAC.5